MCWISTGSNNGLMRRTHTHNPPHKQPQPEENEARSKWSALGRRVRHTAAVIDSQERLTRCFPELEAACQHYRDNTRNREMFHCTRRRLKIVPYGCSTSPMKRRLSPNVCRSHVGSFELAKPTYAKQMRRGKLRSRESGKLLGPW